MKQCPKCHRQGCWDYAFRIRGYDPRLRMFLCTKCGHQYYARLEKPYPVLRQEEAGRQAELF